MIGLAREGAILREVFACGEGGVMTTELDRQQDVYSRLKATNLFSQRIMFVVEPWGTISWMEPGDVFDVVAKGPPNGVLERAIDADAIAVRGWAGSLVAVYQDGERLGPNEDGQPRVPPYPWPQALEVDTAQDD